MMPRAYLNEAEIVTLLRLGHRFFVFLCVERSPTERVIVLGRTA